MRETIVSRLATAGTHVLSLASAYDVDRPEDLERLLLDLEGRDPASEDYPLATARALAAFRGTVQQWAALTLR